MAGTRLLVVVSFLIPFSIWVAVSALFGIAGDDRIWYKLGGGGGGMRLPPPVIDVAPVHVYVEKNHVAWNRLQGQSRFALMKGELGDLCSSRRRPSDTLRGIVICPHGASTTTRPEFFIASPYLALLYPTKDESEHMVTEFLALFSSRTSLSFSPSNSNKIQVAVWIEANVPKIHRIKAVDAVTAWLQQHASLEFSCFGGFQLLELNATVPSFREHAIAAKDLAHQPIFVTSDDDDTRLVLFVASSNTTSLEGGAKEARVGGRHHFAVEDTVEAISSTLSHAVDSLVQSICWGLPPHLAIRGETDEEILEFMDSVFYKHRLVFDEQAAITAAVERTAHLLSFSRGGSDLRQWFQELSSLLHISASLPPTEALARITTARALMDRIQRHPSVLLVADFPLDQYAAIFAPLLFPLLLPITFTLLREIKRLRSKKAVTTNE